MQNEALEPHHEIPFQKLQRNAIAITLVALLFAAFTIFFIARQLIVSELSPEVEKKSLVLGTTTLAPIEKALKLGIPLQNLREVDDYFASIIEDNEEILSLRITDANQKELYGFQNPSASLKHSKEIHISDIPIMTRGASVGTLHVSVNINLFEKTLEEALMDVLIVLLITFIVALEIMVFVYRYRVNEPIKALLTLIKRCAAGHFTEDVRIHTQDEVGFFSEAFSKFIKKINNVFFRLRGRVEIHEILTESPSNALSDTIESIQKNNQFSLPITTKSVTNIFHIRLPLFMFLFAESLSGAFLPLYSKDLYIPIFGLPKEMAIALPIMMFMAMYALSQPLSGIWSEFVNKRYVFLSGGILYALSALGTALSSNLFDFIFWRLLAGFGYGIFVIASQTYILSFKEPRKRVQNTAIFMGGLYSATVCGNAMGAVIAEGIGFRATLFVGFAFALFAVILTRAYIQFQEKKSLSFKQWPAFETLLNIVRKRNFRNFLSMIAIPSRIFSSGCLFYALPLYLNTQNFSVSVIGRIIMLYGLFIYAIGYVTARYIDRKNSPLPFIIWGSFLGCSSGLFFFLPMESLWTTTLFVIVLGLGHSLSLTAQVTVPPLFASQDDNPIANTAALSVYRFFEILGFAVGPLLMAILNQFFPIPTSIILLSVSGMGLCLLYWLFCAKAARKDLEAFDL